MRESLIVARSRSPFLIDGPTQICFSGGRTSGYMLHQILEANGGLPPDCHVTFQNTGKEAEETLEFVDDVSRNFRVKIDWLEWDGFIPPGRSACNFRIVDFETASRRGEPFDLLTTQLGYLPNPTQRVCTANLKVKTGQAFMKFLGYESWDNFMGIRFDEPRRIARMRAPGRDNSGGEPVMPLADMRITKRHVGAFWKRMPFDLKLYNDNGTTPRGNCDLCFLKRKNQVLSLIREKPASAQWWIDQERKIAIAGTAEGQCEYFRSDRPSYGQMLEFAKSQGEMYPYDDEALVDCMCGDGEEPASHD